jgi:hypothetical protein
MQKLWTRNTVHGSGRLKERSVWPFLSDSIRQDKSPCAMLRNSHPISKHASFPLRREFQLRAQELLVTFSNKGKQFMKDAHSIINCQEPNNRFALKGKILTILFSSAVHI